MHKQNIPWILAATRIALGPILIAGAWLGSSPLLLASIVVIALLSDVFDGILARRWHCDTASVRLFDSMADTAFYLCTAVALWIAQPTLILHNIVLLAGLLLLESLRFAHDFAKFGKPASFHSWLAKFWGLTLAAAVIAAFLSANSGMLLAGSLVLGLACNLEGLAMSAILPVWRRDVKTLSAAWAIREKVLGNPLATSQPAGKSASHLPAALPVTLALLILLTVPAFAAETVPPQKPSRTASAAKAACGLAMSSPQATMLLTVVAAVKPDASRRLTCASLGTAHIAPPVVAHHATPLKPVAAKHPAAPHSVKAKLVEAAKVTEVAVTELPHQDPRSMLGTLRAHMPHLSFKAKDTDRPVQQ